MIVLRPVRDVVLVEVRDVVALELDEPALLQLVKPLDHARAPQVHATEAPSSSSSGMRRPAVVERILGLGRDLADRRLDRGSVPGLLAERLVALGMEQGQG